MKKVYIFVLLVLFILILPGEIKAQTKLRPYLNAGYVTALKLNSDCSRLDAGGSIRIGILTKGKIGFYSGYVWFKEYHQDYIEYDDKGSLIIGGIDILLLRKGDFECFIKLGIANEKYISTYSNKTETETSIKPDLGLLFNFKHFNSYIGWQPSDPSHFNIGIGFTI